MTRDTNDRENDARDGLQDRDTPVLRDPEPLQGDDEKSDEASGTAAGVNEAVGPAEEEDQENGDDRDLTTDISPSD